MSFNRFTIIGSGNVATWLAYKITQSGGQIVQIYSRNIVHTKRLTACYGGTSIDTLSELSSEADIYIFAIHDDAYHAVLRQLPFQLPFAIHTAGSLPIVLLEPYSRHFGVLYPCQTISRQADFESLEVPLCIEGNHNITETQLETIAQTWQSQYYVIDGQQRAYLHLAATIASNFSNLMYRIAFDILASKQMNPQVIEPLIRQTALKIAQTTPREAQTGPAQRGDMTTQTTHLKLLTTEKLKEMYRLLSQFIVSETSDVGIEK
ncbi:MAG: DUF2520 domain-containing protein [Bacteroidales bacterium]|jgi:predicted short-subunit dehydrogenase-like oxidoreductase (DUF2520 family)|nr:DUF2520 domain-containing protein [Bacteroidales bacterium]